MRANILLVLYTSHPLLATEQTIALTLKEAGESIDGQELRRELDYLEEKELVRIHEKDTVVWKSELTGYGIDVVEGAKNTPPGIAQLFR